MTLTGMTFSPIDEELFFRGIVHKAFSESLEDNKASVIDSSAFALTYISHFELVFIYNKWVFYTVPALIWVLAMFFIGIFFFQMKNYQVQYGGPSFAIPDSTLE